MKGKTILVLTALSAVPFIMVLGNSMLIPVLPQMQKTLGISQFQTSLIISLFSIPAGLSIPFAGFLSDRIGRKMIIVPSLLLYGIGGLVAGTASLFLDRSAYWAIIAGRIIQGIGAAGTAPVAMALVGDIFTTKERSKALGYIEASNGMGKVTSPILGSLIALVAWYATFFLFPLLTVPIAAGVWFIVKEPSGKRSTQSIKQYFGSIGTIFKNKAAFLTSAFLAGALSLLLLFGILFFLSDYLESTLKLFGVRKGLVLAIPVLAMSVTSLTTGTLIKKKVPLMKKLVIFGLGILTLTLGTLPFFKSPWVHVGIMSAAGIGVGMILPCLNTLITSSAAAQQRGMVTSLYGGIRFFGVAAGPPLFGLLDNYSEYVMFWTGAGAALSLGLVSLVALPSKVTAQASEQSGSEQPEINDDSTRHWGQIFLETITFRNSIGALVTRKSLKPKTSAKAKERKNDEEPPKKPNDSDSVQK